MRATVGEEMSVMMNKIERDTKLMKRREEYKEFKKLFRFHFYRHQLTWRFISALDVQPSISNRDTWFGKLQSNMHETMRKATR